MDQRTKDRTSLPVVWIAAAALVVYAGVSIGFLLNLGPLDGNWDRALLLYAGIEAIAFAAAGFLFGSEVNRQRAVNAEDRSDLALEAARDARRESDELRGLAQAVSALVDAKLEPRAGLERHDVEQHDLAPHDVEPSVRATATHTDADLEEIRALVDRMAIHT